MLLDVALAAAARAQTIDLDEVIRRAPSPRVKQQIRSWPGEHYRLLPALAGVVGAKNIVEIGTFQGASALAFLSDPSVCHLTTFDVLPWDAIPNTLLEHADFSGCLQQVIGDLSEPNTFLQNAEMLRSAELIFIDGPKDGRFEYRFLEALYALAPAVPQLVILDDIRVMTMLDCWRQLPTPKLDLTSFGHWSGTGLLWRTESQDIALRFELSKGYQW
jgi:predicted O-methyltransferase YrrM